MLNSDLLHMGRGLIGGEWRAANNNAVVEVTNPATGETVGTTARMGADEAQAAVDAAAAAMPQWRAMPGKARGALLHKWHQLMLDNADELARIMTAEQGKPLAEARGEAAYGAAFLEWFGEEAKRDGGDIIPPLRPNTQIRVTREAAGVAAMITPWNFPIAMLTRKLGPALAAGCAAVCKPANLTPLSAMAVAELSRRAGIPAGVVNVIAGDSAAIGQVWCASPPVRVLSFTGSTEVGKKLAAACAPTVKKLALELGGNAPFIVFDDADLERAAQQAMLSKFRNAGQTCVCANRIYAQAGIYDAFVNLLTAKTRALKVGNGADEGVEIGPLIEAAAVQKAERLVADATARGATVACGGAATGGLFFAPTVLTGMTDEMAISCEEIFAPVAAVYRFDDEDEAVARANNTEYGLAAYFCARDVGRVMRVSERLEAGIVGVNEGIISSEVTPFGGVKESGLGREGGRYGMDEYTEIKYTLIGY